MGASGSAGAGLREFLGERAQLAVFRCFQAADLLFERADAADLADIGGHGPEQEIARHVESPRGDVAPVGVELHIAGARQALRQAVESPLLHLGIRRQQRFSRLLKRGGVTIRQILRSDKSGP